MPDLQRRRRVQNSRPLIEPAAHAGVLMATATMHALQQHRQRPHQQYWIPPEWIYSEPEHFEGFFAILWRLLKTFLSALAIFFLSLFTYLCLYQIAMPNQLITETLYFDYGGYPETSSVLSQLCTYFLPNSPSPSVKAWSEIDLLSSKHSWDAHESSIGPQSISVLPLESGRPYHIDIVLELPESEHNRHAGMFGVVTTIMGDDKSKLAVSRRSSRLPHESDWVRVVRNCLTLVPLLVGAWDETRSVVIPAYQHYVHQDEARFVRIELVHSSVEVVSGKLRLGPEFNEFQLLLMEWYWTCLVVGTLSISMFYTMIWITMSTPQNPELEFDPSVMLDLGVDEGEDDAGFEDWDAMPSNARTEDGTSPGIRENEDDIHHFGDSLDDGWEDVTLEQARQQAAGPGERRDLRDARGATGVHPRNRTNMPHDPPPIVRVASATATRVEETNEEHETQPPAPVTPPSRLGTALHRSGTTEPRNDQCFIS